MPLQRASSGLVSAPSAPVSERHVIFFPPQSGQVADDADHAGAVDTSPAQLLALQRQEAPSPGPAGAGDGSAAPPAAAAPPPAAAAPGAAPAGRGAPAGSGDADLDDLGRRLYDRIRDLLTAELAIDRERAGLLNDLGLR